MLKTLDKVRLPAGVYVLAVSGGVDSMTLLDLLAKQTGVELVVAHFDHGIRSDGNLDKQLVRRAAKKYGTKAELGRGKLGPGASEEEARVARYGFLNGVKDKYSAKAIITAHHQDDLIETAMLNLLRGSGRRGLSAISSSDILRPLLRVPKSQIINYARENNLEWREDSTNADPKYLRNYLRQGTLKTLDERQRRSLVDSLEEVGKTNRELDKQIATLSQRVKSRDSVNRARFIQLPGEVADELMMLWLREDGLRQFDRKTIQRLSIAIKTAAPGTKQAIRKGFWLEIDQRSARFVRTD